MKFLKKGSTFKALVVLIFAFSIFVRLLAFNQEGGDHTTYKQAVDEFLSGVNPYKYTVMSFATENQKHGYAYMPTLLYMQTALVKINGFLKLDAPTIILWKIPVLLADIGIGVIIYLITKKRNAPKPIILLGLIFWFFNPYFLMRYEYTNYETLPILFTLLALLTISKKDFYSGILFAIAVSLKTFPIILLAVFLLKTKSIKKFLLGGFIVAILISLPFMKTPTDIGYYINGALLVHAERGIQGRPVFSFITYYLQNFGISFYQSEFNVFYALVALFGAQALPLFLYFKKKISNIWILSLSSFFVYFLFAPVLNRTHLLWGLPIIFLGLLSIYENRLNKFYISIGIFYIMTTLYYLLWDKGFRNPVTFGGKIWIDPVYDDKSAFNLVNELYIKAVVFKKSIWH